MSVDLELQLAAYGEHLEMLAIAAAPDTEIPTPVSGRRTYWRGVAVAVAAAVIVFLVVGSIALLSPLSEEEPDTVIEPPTRRRFRVRRSRWSRYPTCRHQACWHPAS